MKAAPKIIEFFSSLKDYIKQIPYVTKWKKTTKKYVTGRTVFHIMCQIGQTIAIQLASYKEHHKMQAVSMVYLQACSMWVE